MAGIIQNKLVKPRDGIDFSRSIFNYEKRHSTNIMAGLIVPMNVQFLYPGSTPDFRFGCVVESAPLISTNLDNIYIDIVTIWNPLRLVMSDFNQFLGESDTNAFTLNRNVKIPKLDTVIVSKETSYSGDPSISRAYLADHFLAPHIGYRQHTDITFSTDTHVHSESLFKKGISVLPSRIYELDWNTFFRNENLQGPRLIDKTSVLGSYDTQNYTLGLGRLLKAGLLKTFYTLATPAPSLLDVSIGLGELLPVVAGSNHNINIGQGVKFANINDGSVISSAKNLGTAGNGILAGGDGSLTNGIALAPNNLWAETASLTVNKMYYALMEQRFANKLRYGTRAVEFYANFFGVRDSDMGHDLPTLITHKRFPINVSAVIATASSTDGAETSQLGQRGAFSYTGFGDSLVKNFTATEHGYLMTYAIIRGQPSLFEGIDHFLGIDNLMDTYIPEFDHIGPVGIERLEVGDTASYSNLYYGYTNAWYAERNQISDVVGILEPGQPLAYKTLAYSLGPTVQTMTTYSPKFMDHIFMFPVFYGTPMASGFDSDGCAFNQNRYQFLVQFVVKGKLAAVMSPDSEPLKLKL